MAYLEDAMEEYCHATGTGNIPADQDMTKQTSLQNEEFAEDDLFIDADGWLIKSNDQVRLVNYTERELNGAIGTVYFHDPQGHRRDHVNVFMPTISEDTAISISIHNLRKFILSGSSSATPDLGLEPLIDWSEMPPERDHVDDEATIRLVDMSSDIKRQISSFLPLFDVEQNLRNVCRDTFWNFRKPPPEHLDYDFIYFYGSNAETAEWHGVAHLTRDVYRALKDHDWHMGEEGGLSLSLMFVKFDRSQPIVPLFKFDNNREPDELLLSEWDPIGVQYCSVKQASHIELEFCPVFVEELDDPSQTKNRDFISILRHCDEWQPRGPRIPLQYFGTRKSDCEYCGKGDAFCRCELSGPGGEHGKDVRIYYSPQWFFSNNSYCYSAPSGSAEPAVVIFQHQAELNRFQI